MTDFDLTGRTALVTGGNVGIGQATALALAEHGADVAITYLSHDGHQTVQAIQQLGRRGFAARLDATDGSAIQRVVGELAEQLDHHIDILFNNAGGLMGRVSLEEMTPAHFANVMAVNVASAFFVTQAALPFMTSGWGRIVMMGSVAAHQGGGNGALAYAASKGAIHTLTRGLAKELAPRNITVNAVAPGYIAATPFHEKYTPRSAQDAMIQQTLVKRPGMPRDVAAAVVYLASPEASYLTGEIMEINGGTHFA